MFRSVVFRGVLSLTAASTLALAQDPGYVPQPTPPQQSDTGGGWRRVDPPPASQVPNAPNAGNPASAEPNDPQPQGPAPADPQASDPNQGSAPNQGAYPEQGPSPNQAPPYANQGPYRNDRPGFANRPQQGPYEPGGTLPARLTIRPGTFITLRVNQTLSSDHNQPGDAFTASLVKPIVVDGVVVAQRGETVAGRVAQAQKAGRSAGVSRLGLELTDLTLVDGEQVPLHSQLVSRTNTAPGINGRDVETVIGTTALGAAIGGAVGWGTGAGIGAGAGAAAGLLGVMLTRGHPTVVYPETVLTFRIDQPVTVATDRAPQAFRYVNASDYDRPYDRMQPQPRSSCGPNGCGPGYYSYGYYGPAYYPYYYGPGFGFYYGSGFYWGPRYYRYGYRGYRWHGYRR